MEKTMQEKINNYNRQLQRIDFQLSQIIKYGIVIFGQPKSGKTAVSHLLSGNILKGVKINGKVNVQLATSKNKKAIIKNEPSSYTPLPNILSIDHYNKQKNKICIIDTPGFRNDHGGFMLLATGYCYYRVFEKVQHMKFILCFDINQFWHPDQLFIDTILQFTSHFKNYEEQKHQIWKSCVFLINKVDERILSLDNFKTKLKQIFYVKIQKKPQEIKLVKQFICYIVDNYRLFTIRKFKEHESDTNSELIKEIDKKASWWSREFDRQNQEAIQMSQIQINLSKLLLVELKDNKTYKQEIIKLIDYYNQRINEICSQQNSCSLNSIFNELIKDATGSPYSHNFLNLMKQYVDKYYHAYDINYKQERKKMQKQIFDLQRHGINYFKNTIPRKKNQIVKKFHSLKDIQQTKQQCRSRIKGVQNKQQGKQFQKRIKITKQLMNAIKNIIQQFRKICYRQQIVYNYGYMLHRVISQINIFHKLFDSQQKKIKEQLQSAIDGHFIISLNRQLLDCFQTGYRYNGSRQLTYEQIKDSYIKDVNLQGEEYRYINIGWQFVDFISQNQSDEPDPQIVEKAIKVLLKFSQQYLEKIQNKHQNINEIRKLISRLTIARFNSDQIYQLSENQYRKNQLLFLIRNLTNNLGRLLLKIKMYDLARKVYASILFVDTVCSIYKQQIQQLTNTKEETKQKTKKLFRLRMEYFNYLKSHFHQKEGIIILQQCFQHAQDMNELNEAVHSLSEQLINQNDSQYTKKVLEKNLFQRLEYELFI